MKTLLLASILFLSLNCIGQNIITNMPNNIILESRKNNINEKIKVLYTDLDLCKNNIQINNFCRQDTVHCNLVDLERQGNAYKATIYYIKLKPLKITRDNLRK